MYDDKKISVLQNLKNYKTTYAYDGDLGENEKKGLRQNYLTGQITFIFIIESDWL